MSRLIDEEASFTVEANLPQEAFDKILGNTREQMDKMLKQGYAFDLSDGEDRTVAYISFPKGTKPEDVAIVVRCKDCKYKPRWDPTIEEKERCGFDLIFPSYSEGNRCICQCEDDWYGYMPDDDFYCANGKRKE